MFILRLRAFQRKHLVVQNVLSVRVFNNNVEKLNIPVYLNVVLKIRKERQFNAKHRPRDRLDQSRQFELWELMYKFVKGSAHLGDTNKLAEIRRGEVCIARPFDVTLAL